MHDAPRLLIDEPPLQVLPSLATAIGLNEALFLQQLHYQLRLRRHLIDDVPWVYHTLEEWHSIFPFWALSTIRRIITRLEQLKLLLSANHNAKRQVQTRWYTINYSILDTMSMNNSVVQNGQLRWSDWTTEMVRLDNSCLPKTSSKTFSKEEIPPLSPQGRRRTKARTVPVTAYTPGFDLMWQAYPAVRREGKVATFAIWQARGLEARAPEITEKLTRLTQTTWVGREKHYIPMPQTWFNQARYEDDLVPLEAVSAQQEREGLSAREYRERQAMQRFLERTHADTAGQSSVSGRDETTLDRVQYRID